MNIDCHSIKILRLLQCMSYFLGFYSIVTVQSCGYVEKVDRASDAISALVLFLAIDVYQGSQCGFAKVRLSRYL